jgi:hypothetical protein
MGISSLRWSSLLLYLALHACCVPLGVVDDSGLTSNPPLLYITLEEHYDPKAILPLQTEDPVYDLYDTLVTPEQTRCS